MPSFSKQGFATPFGKNEFLRSTRDVKTLSRMLAASTVPAQTIDNFTGQKIIQPGTVLAKIITGPEAGKVGPFQTAGVDEVQTLTGTGTITGGTYTITVLGGTTTALAFNANAATIQSALRAAIAAGTGSPADKAIGDGITVTGGPINTTPVVITYDAEVAADVPQATVNTASLTGTTPGVTPTTTTAGVAGATDGRGDVNNIVGLCKTFLPWQTIERDVEVAVIYEAAVIQSQCIILNANGTETALDDTTAAAMFGKKTIDIKFVS
jgi:hypothetical protein